MLKELTVYLPRNLFVYYTNANNFNVAYSSFIISERHWFTEKMMPKRIKFLLTFKKKHNTEKTKISQ